MRSRLAVVVVASLAALVCAAPAGARAHWQAFRTPSGHIRCEYFVHALRCDIDDGTYTPPKHDCHGTGDSGFSFGLTPTGRGRVLCVSDAEVPSHHVLAYGHEWSRDGIVCHSRATGLRCRNRRGHFIFLSRQTYGIG